MSTVANPDVSKVVATYKRSATKFSRSAVSLRITDDDSLKAASQLLGQIKTISKELKTKKDSIVKPLKEAMANTKQLFAAPEEELASTEKLLKDAILTYHQEQAAKAQKTADRLEQRVQSGSLTIDKALAKLANIPIPSTQLGGAQIREGREKVRIIDVGLLISQHPEYLLRERVLEALRMEVQQDFARQRGLIPAGVEIHREKIVAGVAA